MQYISNDYKTALADLMREPRAKVEHTNYTIYDSTDLIEIKISAAMGERLFGNTPSKAATLTIQNASSYEFELGDQFTIHIGLTLADKSIEYIKQGIFILDNFELDEVNNKITLNLFDKMVKFNAKYNNDAFIFPKNINTFIAELASAAEVELQTNTSYSFELESAPNAGEGEFTLRDMLGWSAELVGANAIVDHNGKLVIKRYEVMPSVVLTADDYDEFKAGKAAPAIDGVFITHQPENDSVSYPYPMPANSNTYNVVSNAVSYFNREDIVAHVYAATVGHNYDEFTLNWRGNYALELGDKITIYDTEDNVFYSSFYTNFDFTFDGSTKEELYVEILSQEEVDRRTAHGVREQRNQTAFVVDKIHNRIDGVVEVVDDNTTEIGKLWIEAGELGLGIEKVEGDIENIELTQTWFAYADDAIGTNFSLTPQPTSRYMGSAQAVVRPTTYAGYSNWVLIKGADGAPGQDGQPGQDGNDGAPGTPGADGKSWHTGPSNPTNTIGKVGDFYLNNSTYELFEKTGATKWTSRGIIKGDQGDPGIPGSSGSPGADGITYYTWIVYAENEHGDGLTTDPTDKAFMGLSYGNLVALPSNNPLDYDWMRIIGIDGADGRDGVDGKSIFIAYANDTEGTDFSFNAANQAFQGIYVGYPPQSEDWMDYTWQPTNWEVSQRITDLAFTMNNELGEIRQSVSDSTTTINQSITDLETQFGADISNKLTAAQVEALITTLTSDIKQTADGVEFDFGEFLGTYEVENQEVQEVIQNIKGNIKFTINGIEIRHSSSNFYLKLGADRISFMEGEIEVAYIADNKLYITDGEFTDRLTVGNFGYIPRQGGLSFRKVK